MNRKIWGALITLFFVTQQHQPVVDAFVPTTATCSTRSSVKTATRSTTALDMTKTTSQQRKQLEAVAVASLIALTVATSSNPPLSAGTDQVVANTPVMAAAKPSTPQVTVTPFGGGFGGIGLSPFGLNPFGGLGAGFGVRITPRPQTLPPEQQLEAMKEYRAQMDARIKMMEQQQAQAQRQNM